MKRGRSLTSEESNRIRRRGYQAERELVRILRERGYNAVRIPASAPSGEPLPDLFAVKGIRLLAFEVKSPGGGRAYFYREQVSKLFAFLRMFEVYPERYAVLAARLRDGGRYRWVFKRVEEPGDYVLSSDEECNISL